MKHQLCRNCGHRHRLGDPCVFEGGTGRKSPDDIGRASEENACLTATPLTPGAYRKRLRVDGAVQDQNIRKQAALSSAQKQKAYREKHGDKYREANRLRMAAKRKE